MSDTRRPAGRDQTPAAAPPDMPLNTLAGAVQLGEWLRHNAPGFALLDVEIPGAPEGTPSVPLIVAPGHHGGAPSVVGLKSVLDPYRQHPERRVGSAAHLTLDSLIDHMNDFKLPASRLFAVFGDQPSLTVVYDYNGAVAGEGISIDAPPGFMKHRATYRFPLATEWKAWMAKNGPDNAMTQAEFAAFLEDRIGEVSAADSSYEGTELGRIIALLGGSIATPQRMLELSRGLQVRENSTVKDVVNLSSGEVSVQFENTHVDEAGQPLKVPNVFLIVLPMFDGGTPIRMAVRLRYRKKGGGLLWFYEIYRAAETFREEVMLAAKLASDRTGVKLYVGTPESNS